MPKDTEELVSESRTEPAGSAGSEASREGLGTLSGFPNNSSIEVMFDSVTLAPGERGQIIFIPDSPLRRPSLFMTSSLETKKATVEQIFHGRTGLNVLKTSSPDGEECVSGLENGRVLDITVTADEPIKVVVVNRDNEKITIKASLVARKKKED